MAGNAWLSATDTMLDGLAQREALARQARLDQEAAARAAQQLAMQQQNLELNRQQTEAQIANQNADNERANNEVITRNTRLASEGKAKARNEEQVAALVDMYQSTADPEAKQRIAMNLAMQGVTVAEPKVTERPGFSLSPGQRRFDADGNVIASAPDRPDRTGAGSDADRGLYMGLDEKTRQYLDSLRSKTDPATGRAYDYQRALDEVSRQTGMRGIFAATVPYLQRIFPEIAQEQPSTNPMDPTPRMVTGRPGAQPVGGVQPTAAAAPLNLSGAVPASAVSDDQARARLVKERIAVTPETLAQAKALIAAGQ